jgi:hypothetical protein
MAASARLLLAGCIAMAVVGCSQTVVGNAVRSAPGLDDDSRSPVDVESVLLARSRMQGITGAGENLTVIPSMDGKLPVDLDQLAETMPDVCRWYFAETQTFGPHVEEFHKTTYQDPPDSALISQGAAAYRDSTTARQAFGDLVAQIRHCSTTESGSVLVGEWAATDDAVRTRLGNGCGRDYRLKSVVLAEVTFCAFPDSVPDIVLTNMMANVPN